ncbi:hypothetical protein NC653_011167 [Populus alba x Populus x berolinensis]|uniref:Uncharacterized protein n=1 Tax=Populus alba x Populus x berolinensis TaxID=444605 RepID=A0AAD6W620_9ROSI|nr:hypothetical protein NC653_011167 [Populus alba x Populus x berolinensis]
MLNNMVQKNGTSSLNAWKLLAKPSTETQNPALNAGKTTSNQASRKDL